MHINIIEPQLPVQVIDVGILARQNVATPAVCWVAPGATGGQRGRLDRPFGLLSQAVAAAQDGDTINLLPGTYEEPSTVLITKPLTIIGRGAVIESTAEGEEGHGVLVRDVRVEIHGLTVTGAGADGIRIERTAWNIDMTQGALVGCRAIGNGGNGIAIAGRIIILPPSRFGWIEAWTVRDCHAYDNGGSGFDLKFPRRLTMDGCQSLRNGQHGILCYDAHQGTITSCASYGNSLSEAGEYDNIHISEYDDGRLIGCVASTTTQQAFQPPLLNQARHNLYLANSLRMIIMGNCLQDGSVPAVPVFHAADFRALGNIGLADGDYTT